MPLRRVHRGMTHGDPAKGGRHGDDGLKIGRQGLQPVFDFLDKAKKDGKPFFVWYAPMMPHSPHNPPERLLRRSTRTRRKSQFTSRSTGPCASGSTRRSASCSAKLEKNGQAKNTLVIYLHDNGWIQDPNSRELRPEVEALALRRRPAHADHREVAGPGEAGRERPARVLSIDLAPTILRAAGAKPPTDMPGINLLDAKWLAGRDTRSSARSSSTTRSTSTSPPRTCNTAG